MPATQTNPTTELTPTVDWQAYFNSDAPCQMIFRYKGDTIKYSCSEYTFSNGKKDITKCFTIANELMLFPDLIRKNSISVRRHLCGKKISLCIKFSQMQKVQHL